MNDDMAFDVMTVDGITEQALDDLIREAERYVEDLRSRKQSRSCQPPLRVMPPQWYKDSFGEVERRHRAFVAIEDNSS